MHSIVEFIIILSDDISYSTLLMRYLKEHKKFTCPIQLLSKVEYCTSFVETERIKFILTEEKFYEELKGSSKLKDAVVIPLYTGIEKKEGGIYKYQSAEEIVEGIKSILYCNRERVEEGIHRRISVLNPNADVNVLLKGVLLGICQSKNANVLCIDLEPYSYLDEILFQERHRGLSDYIYFARQGTQDIVRNNKVIRSMKQIYFMSHVDHYSDLNALMPEDIGNICTEAEKEFQCFTDILFIQQITPAIEPYILSSDIIYMDKYTNDGSFNSVSKLYDMLQQKALFEKQSVCFLPTMKIYSRECSNYKEKLFDNPELVNQFLSLLTNKEDA